MNSVRQTFYAFMLLYTCMMSAAAPYPTEIEQVDIATFTDQEKQELLLHMLMRTDTGEFLLFFNEEQLRRVTHLDGEFAYLCKPIYQQIYKALQASQPDQQLQRVADYAVFDTLLSCHTLKAVFDLHLPYETSQKFYATLQEGLSTTINCADVSDQTTCNIIKAWQRVELIYHLQRELEIPVIVQDDAFDQLYAHNVQYHPDVHILYKNRVAALMQQFPSKVQPNEEAIEVFKKVSRETCRSVLENPSQLSIG